MPQQMPSQGCEDRKQNREEIGLEASPSPPPLASLGLAGNLAKLLVSLFFF